MSIEEKVSRLEERITKIESKLSSLSSLLEEYIFTILELQEKLYNNRQVKSNVELSKDFYDTEGSVPREKHIEPAKPLSSLVLATVEEYDTSEDELKRKVSQVADLIIKSGKNLDYISAR
ncbi:MAG: hypothetical protein QXH03_03540 [Candidatus Bathyarchaeia archaeon]